MHIPFKDEKGIDDAPTLEEKLALYQYAMNEIKKVNRRFNLNYESNSVWLCQIIINYFNAPVGWKSKYFPEINKCIFKMTNGVTFSCDRVRLDFIKLQIETIKIKIQKQWEQID